MSAIVQRALLVEDDRSWQLILQEILTDCGFEVDLADNLEAALTQVRLAPHRLAVVDLSLNLADPHNKDGLKVLRQVQQSDPGCKTLLLTGFATVELAVSVLSDYGAFTCLRKETFNRAQFREAVSRAILAAPLEGKLLDQAGEADAVVARHQQAASAAGVALVVEDDAGWRSILYELLLDAGYSVRLCSGYGEALSYLRREKLALALVDLALNGARLDLMAWDHPENPQDLEGYRLLASTRANGIPTIVVSGMANVQSIEKLYAEQGIFAYIEKQTFDRSTFLAMLKSVQTMKLERSALDVLTEREREVLALLSQGMTNQEIADTLIISINTVKRHLKAVFEKLDIHTRAAAAALAAGVKPASEK